MNYSLNIEGNTINKISCNSKTVDANTLFCCLVGSKSDGHSYVQQAYENGCRTFCVSKDVSLPSDCVVLRVADTRKAMAEYSSMLFNEPSKKMKMIGITGTKGKSTVATITYELLNKSGIKTAFIGTTGIDIGSNHYDTVNTTPESNILQEHLAKAYEEGCKVVVMEVSSQAEKLNRVYGIEFDIAAFTNLSEDHIGPNEHLDYDDYRNCKSMLFKSSKISIINKDDIEADYFNKSSKGKVYFYSTVKDSDYKATDILVDKKEFSTTFNLLGNKVVIPLAGMFNVYNCVCAIAICCLLGVSPLTLTEQIKRIHGAKGRLERIDLTSFKVTDRQFILDYAHNGLSLEQSLQVLRDYCQGRLICLFGAIGGRAKHRRQELAEACKKYADYAIITSDNPDYEDPQQIIDEIDSFMGSFPRSKIIDRKEAIEFSLNFSKPGDLILFAGKGHEDYQIINGEHQYFNEKEILINAIVSHNLHK